MKGTKREIEEERR